MLIFINIQTTGLEIDDKIISIGLIGLDGEDMTEVYDEVNEGKKISAKASSINHITNEMIKDKPRFEETQAYRFLQENNTQNNILIAHNVKFTLEKLLACGIDFVGKIVDTLRVTKHLIPECEGFSLQLLRYELKVYRKERRKLYAHHALDDAYVIKLLFEDLLDYATLEEMHILSFKNVLVNKFKYGKYAGRYIEDIFMNDRGYLEWMLSNVVDLDEDLKYTIHYYLGDLNNDII